MSSSIQRGATLLLGIVAMIATLTGLAQENTLEQAITEGKAGIALRYRYEFVDQDGFSDNANASTLRLRLNYATGNWSGWTGLVEFDHLAELLVNDFNSGAGSSPDRNQYPSVVDVKGSDLNQLYFDYVGIKDLRVRLGRQRILLDNQRYVGGVGWRQNEQTFDGLTFMYAANDGPEVAYTYVTNANRIFGDEVAAGDHSQNTHLLNGKYSLSKDWQGTAYGYYIDNDDAPAFSTFTVGAKLSGGLPMDNGTLKLSAELAHQSDAANNPVSYDASYGRFDLTWLFNNTLSAGISFETLEGDANTPNSAFRTPLATLHLFQGWADQFLTTPNGGINDVSIVLGYNPAPWKLNLVYHDFSAESGGGDYGSELDFAAGRKLGKRHSLLLKLARFDADSASGFSDTTKVWVMASMAF